MDMAQTSQFESKTTLTFSKQAPELCDCIFIFGSDSKGTPTVRMTPTYNKTKNK